MSDTSGESPPTPSTDPNGESPPSSDVNASPPAPSDQGSPSNPPSNGGGPTSPPPPEDSPSLLPPLIPSDQSPPPPEESKSPPPAASPPPAKSPPPAASPPPEKSTPVSSPPPTKSNNKSPPPPSESKSPPPKNNDDSPSPPSPDRDVQSPPPPEFKPPASDDSPVPPQASPTTPSPRTPDSAPPAYFAPPTSTDPTTTPTKAVPSASDSRSDTSSSSSSSSDSPTEASQSSVHPGAVAGAALAGVFLLAVLGLFFVCSSRRRRRKRAEVYNSGQYMPAGTISIKSEGYYPGQQQHMNYSGPGPTDMYYAPPTPSSNVIHSYGSQRGGANSEAGLNMGGPNPYFSYDEMVEITGGFAAHNVLGEGGFGCVYKGVMGDGRQVAVKQLKAGSGQGEREFKAEVEIISRVHHRHLVSLVGYCISEHHRLLVYEFVSNNTLEHHLHGPGMPVLEWSKRLKIALGAAKGLAYLHEDCHPKIIHRDIKSANILLEDSFEAQVADFGLAKPSNDMHTHVSTRVMGTFGYMAPEYASSGKLTDRSDVYSFGVVLLELITGRKPVDPTRPMGDESLVEWARPLLIDALETGDLSDLVDRRLEKHYVEGEIMRMVEAAAACVRHSAPKRPRMVQVARALDCEGEMSDLSNGVKYGQSTIYESGQYNQDIMKFRKMALEDSSEYDMYSGEFGNSRETKLRDGSSGESETRAFHAPRYGGRPF